MSDVTRLAALEAVVRNFEIRGPDDDGLVWMVFHGHGTTGQGAVNFGTKDRLVAQVALALEQDRRAALAALPAPAATAREVVTLAVWEYPEGDIRFVRAKQMADAWAHPWKRLGTVTLTVEPGA